MGSTEIDNQKTPSKTGLSKHHLALRAPNETLTVGEALDRARALLRARQDHDAYSLWAHRLTLLEDWLELEHPRCDRSELQRARRKCEDRIADWIEPPEAKALRRSRHLSHLAQKVDWKANEAR